MWRVYWTIFSEAKNIDIVRLLMLIVTREGKQFMSFVETGLSALVAAVREDTVKHAWNMFFSRVIEKQNVVHMLTKDNFLCNWKDCSCWISERIKLEDLLCFSIDRLLVPKEGGSFAAKKMCWDWNFRLNTGCLCLQPSSGS